MKRERLMELREETTQYRAVADDRCMSTQYEDDLLALIDAEITRQSVTDEAVQRAIEWMKNIAEHAEVILDEMKAKEPHVSPMLYKRRSELAKVCIAALRQYQFPSAIQWTGNNLREVIDLLGWNESASSKWTWEEYEQVVAEKGLKVFTPDGSVMAEIGDWIIENGKDCFVTRQYQKPTDEAVRSAIGWMEAEKASAQNNWERAGAEWRMEPGAKAQHDERMASFDLAIQALCQMKPSEWIPVSERLPESGKEVLMNVAYNNRNQSKYDKVTKGFYVERFSIKEETWSDFTGNEDYCEEDDAYYIRQGWYSVCNFVDDFSYIDVPSGFTVTHWMPLPNPPESW